MNNSLDIFPGLRLRIASLAFIAALMTSAPVVGQDGERKIWRPKPSACAPSESASASPLAVPACCATIAAPPPAAEPVVAPTTAPIAPAPPQVETPPRRISISAKALFPVGSAVLSPDGKAAIDRDVVQNLRLLPQFQSVRVTGHSDRQGSTAVNERLSKARAEAVRSYLLSVGVPAVKVTAQGLGARQPLPGVTCADTLKKAQLNDCLAPNRRIEIEVVPNA